MCIQLTSGAMIEIILPWMQIRPHHLIALLQCSSTENERNRMIANLRTYLNLLERDDHGLSDINYKRP